MAIKTVNWVSDQFLNCACVVPAAVILGLAPELVVVTACADEGTPAPLHHIVATLTGYVPVNSGCGQPRYRYTFTYDDSLVVGAAQLVSSDIEGVVCEGVLTNFIRDKAGAPIQASFDADTGELTITDQFGCQTVLTIGVP